MLKTKTVCILKNSFENWSLKFTEPGSPTSADLKNHINSYITPKDVKLISNENRHLGLSNDIKFVKNGDRLDSQKQFWNLIIKIFTELGSPTSVYLKNHKNSHITPNDMKLISNENRHLGLSNNIKCVKNEVHLHP